MQKLIEINALTRDNEFNVISIPLLINLQHVVSIQNNGQYAIVEMASGVKLKTGHTYNELRDVIGIAQGGIPSYWRTEK